MNGPLQGEAIIFGAGRLGTTLACMLKASGIRIQGLGCKTLENAQSAVDFVGAGVPFVYSSLSAGSEEILQKFFASWGANSPFLLFFTTPDDVLADVVQGVSSLRKDWSHTFVLHCSGGLDIDVLSPFLLRGAKGGVLHPCYPIYQPTSSLPRDGSVAYTFQGHEELRLLFSKFVSFWKGHFLNVDNINRPCYHAGNVLAAGHLVSLLFCAKETLVASGVISKDALRIVCSLASGVLCNLQQSVSSLEEEIFSCLLTGPFARNDEKLIEKHRQALVEHISEMLAIYDELGKQSRMMKR